METPNISRRDVPGELVSKHLENGENQDKVFPNYKVHMQDIYRQGD